MLCFSRSIFTTFEDKISLFKDFLENNLTEEVKVFIGDEIGLEHIRNCSLVLSRFGPALDKKAFLGVVGPIRMDYSLAISSLKMLRDYLEEACMDNI